MRKIIILTLLTFFTSQIFAYGNHGIDKYEVRYIKDEYTS